MAEGEDDSQKTEEPTPKKMQEARKKGQVALSREVNNWVMLLAGTIVIATLGAPTLGKIKDILVFYIAQAHQIPYGPGGVEFALGEGITRTMIVLAMPIIALMLAAFLAPFIQIGPIFSGESIKPDPSKISIIKGFSRLFSKRSLMEFVKGILKIVVVGTVGFIVIEPYFHDLEHVIALPMPMFMKEMQELIVRMMIGMLTVLLVIAVIDLVYQRMEHAKKMRMTKQELKDEYKQTEGDPHIKSKLRQLRTERARQRMMQNVPKADVVITNPTHYSIALQYDPKEMEAPVCIAKGVDAVALRIREVAKEHDIILFENKPLAQALYKVVDIDEAIPYEHFKAVAEIISYVFKTKGKTMQ